MPSLKCVGFTGRFVTNSSNPTNHSSTSARNIRRSIWSALDLRDGYLPPQPLNHFPTSARNKRFLLWRALVLRVPLSKPLFTTFPERTIHRRDDTHRKMTARRPPKANVKRRKSGGGCKPSVVLNGRLPAEICQSRMV